MSQYSSGQLFAERFKLQKCLNESNSSEIWLAHDSLGREENVVVKIFSLKRPMQAQQQADFTAFYAQLVTLQHPGLLVPNHFDIYKGIPYLMMPYYKQGSLRDMIKRAKPAKLPEVDAIRLLAEIGGALAYLHEQIPPVLHREISPENIIISDDGHYLLADYGRSDTVRTILLQGTSRVQDYNPDYCPPEYLRSNPIFSTQGDIYSLGILVAEVVMGKRPISTQKPDWIIKLLAEKPAHISNTTWEMICRCMNSDPELRPLAGEIAKWAEWRNKMSTSSTPIETSSQTEAPATTNIMNNPLLRWALIGGMIFILGFAGWKMMPHGNATAVISSTKSAVDGNTILRLHGSNTIGAELAPELVTEYLKHLKATRIVRLPKAPDEINIRAEIPGVKTPVLIEIFAHGSATAFKDMEAKSCDIGMSSRRIKDDEIKQLSRYGDMTAPACEHVLSMDGIAVIVQKDNPLSQLSKAQLLDIYSGKVNNWSQVGGSDLPIKVLARDDKSGTWDTFKTLVLGSEPLIKGAERYEDSDQLRQIVSSDTKAIGFASLTFTRDVKVLAISDGPKSITPTTFTIGKEEYPLSRRLFFYTPAKNENKYVQDFIEYSLSDPGQEICTKVGFVGQKVVAIKNDASQVNLNFSFRFMSGNAVLDNKSVQDLDRLVAFLNQPDPRKRVLCLYGYSDNVGDPQANIALSLERAQAVAQALVARGITPGEVQGFGAENPIAANDTAEGHAKNRRVEVVLKYTE